MSIERELIPMSLINAYKSGKCGFLIGAGMSQASGLPNWPDLLQLLIKHGKNENVITEDKATALSRLADDGTKFLMVAEEIKELLGPQIYAKFLKEIFLDSDPKPGDTLKKIVSLECLQFIITTNYDVLVERALVEAKNEYLRAFTFKDAQSVQAKLYERGFFVLKAHGDANGVGSEIILTDKDYRRLLYHYPDYRSVLMTIFNMYTIVILGSSLVDPELQMLLASINAAFPEGGNTHYALVNTDELTEVELNRWKKDYNLQLIPISSENNFKEMEEFIDILEAEV